MCRFRWCGRQLCLRHMPISGVNSTPRPTAVYASDPASPRRPQDSLPSCLLGFGRTRLALASSLQLPIAPRTGLLPEVGRDQPVTDYGPPRRSATRRQARHAWSGSVSGASRLSFPPTEPPSLHALRRRSSQPCSGASSGLRGSSDPSPVPRQLRLLAFLPRPGIVAATAGQARSPRLRRDPFARDVVFDHRRATAPRVTGPLMSPSTFPTVSASAIP